MAQGHGWGLKGGDIRGLGCNNYSYRTWPAAEFAFDTRNHGQTLISPGFANEI